MTPNPSLNNALYARAIDDCINHRYASVAATARAYGIQQSTLCRRLKNQLPRAESNESQRKVAPEEEDVVFTICCALNKHNIRCTSRLTIQLATAVTQNRVSLGEKWFRCFRSRYPNVVSDRGKVIEVDWKRAGLDPSDVQRILDHSHVIKPQRTTNDATPPERVPQSPPTTPDVPLESIDWSRESSPIDEAELDALAADTSWIHATPRSMRTIRRILRDYRKARARVADMQRQLAEIRAQTNNA